MMFRVIVLLNAVGSIISCLDDHGGGTPEALGPTIDVNDAALLELVDLNSPFTILARFNSNIAHEGPVYVPSSNEVYFSENNTLEDAASNSWHISMYKINLESRVVTKVSPNPEIPMPVGATLFSKDKVLVCSQGHRDVPGALYVLDTKTSQSKRLRLKPQMNFTSPNDVIVSAHHDGYFFSDPPYGYFQQFRPKNTLPPAVYFVDRQSLRVITLNHSFGVDNRPNGIAESLDGKTLYVSDTGYLIGNGRLNNDIPRAIYAYDIITDANGIPDLKNRRIFVKNVTKKIASNLKMDVKGNLYGGVTDGVDIYAPSGKLLGKVRLPTGMIAAGVVFAGKDLLMFANKVIYSITMKVDGLQLPGESIP